MRLAAQRPQGVVNAHDIAQVQANVSRILDQLASNEYLYGVRFTDIAMEAGFENLLEHGLDREPEGFFVVSANAGALVWQVSSSSANVKKFLPLAVSADCTIDLVVF